MKLDDACVDLHIHSTTSDGEFGPSEVVRLAADAGLVCIALTDHDTSHGVCQAQITGQAVGVEVLAGVEINASMPRGDAHILGYLFNIAYAPLQDRLQAMRAARVTRAQAMLEKLAGLGLPLSWEAVQTVAGNAASVARPHIARALLEAGYVQSVPEAFDKYIGSGRPAYVNRLRLEASQAIDLIHTAGGLAVLAHAGLSGLISDIQGLVQAGLDGLEVYYPDHTPQHRAELLAAAETYGLLVTGGSDFHTFSKPLHRIGQSAIPYACVEKLKARWIERKAHNRLLFQE